MNEVEKTYFKYWGKANNRDDGNGYDYHLLPYHCLDVAAVAQLLAALRHIGISSLARG